MAELTLHGIEIPIYLGVFDYEQLQKQVITVNLKLCYHNLPKGCVSDAHQDVICYATLNELLLRQAGKKRYQLIEHVAHCFMQVLLENITLPVDVSVTIFKKPPLDNVAMASFKVERKWQQ